MRINHTTHVLHTGAASLAGWLLATTMAFAQPPPQTQPLPQDPTPVPAARPPAIDRPEPKLPQPAPAGRLTPSEARFTGCLQRAEETESGARAAGAAARAGAESRLSGGYVLTQATTTRVKDAEKGGQAPPGTKEYRLVAKDDSIKLADHVGHQVELKGRITLDAGKSGPTSTESGTSTSRPSGSTGVSTAPPTGDAVAAPPVTLTVTSLKMVAPSCSTPAS
jgi:hypothetical protein